MPRDVTGRIRPASREINGQRVEGFAVDASPALAVDHGVIELASRRPALAVSGVNFGANLGIEVTISGTVGAALEASAFGIPALAVSLEMSADHHLTGDAKADYAASRATIRHFAEMLLAHNLPHDIDVLNVNIPAGATPETPWRLTWLSRHRYFLPVPPGRDSGEGRPGYRVIENVMEAEPGSDIQTLLVDRMISVTPLSLDLTSRVPMDVSIQQLPGASDSHQPRRRLSKLFAWSSGPSDLWGDNGRSGLSTVTVDARDSFAE
jgi:5'-nucleotidase